MPLAAWPRRSVVDLGTGSGAIALAVAAEVPAAHGLRRRAEPAPPSSGPSGTRVALAPAERPDRGGRPRRRAPGARRHGRRRGVEPAVHPRRDDPARPRGAPARPGGRALRRPGRPRPDARGRRHRRAPAAPGRLRRASSTASTRAPRSARSSRTATGTRRTTHRDLTGRDRATTTRRRLTSIPGVATGGDLRAREVTTWHPPTESPSGCCHLLRSRPSW